MSGHQLGADSGRSRAAPRSGSSIFPTGLQAVHVAAACLEGPRKPAYVAFDLLWLGWC